MNSQIRIPDSSHDDDSSAGGSFSSGGRFGGSASSSSKRDSSSDDGSGDLFAPNRGIIGRLTTQRPLSSRRITGRFGGDSSSSGDSDQDSRLGSNADSGLSSGSQEGSHVTDTGFGGGNSDADTSDLISNGNSGLGGNSGTGSRETTDRDKDLRTTRWMTTDSGLDLGDSSFGSNSGIRGGDATSPSYYRIEVEILRLENKGGTLQNGKSSCDFLSACDPRLYADITT